MFLDNELIPHIGKTGKMLGTVITKIFKDKNINLSREQFVVLKILSEKDGQQQQNLAFITECDKTSLSRLISNMEKKKLISRKSSNIDKRIKNVYLTTYGKNIFKTTFPIVKQTIGYLQKGISNKDLKTCIATIEKIQLNINKEHLFKL